MLARKASLLTRKARLTKHFDDLCEEIDSGKMDAKEAFSSVGSFILENDKALKKYSSIRVMAREKQESILNKEFDAAISHEDNVKKSIKLIRKFIKRHKKELSAYPSLQKAVQKKYKELIYIDLTQDFVPVKKSINEQKKEDIDQALFQIAIFIADHKKSLLKYTPFRPILAEIYQELLELKFARISQEIDKKPIEEALAEVENFIGKYKKTLAKFSLLREEIEERRENLLIKKFNDMDHTLYTIEDFLLVHQDGLANHPSLHEKVEEKFRDLLRKEIAVLREAVGKVDPWESISDIEKFIIQHRNILTLYPDDEVKNHYYNLISDFSNNLGEISRNIFLNIAEEDLYNTSVKTTNDLISVNTEQKKEEKAQGVSTKASMIKAFKAKAFRAKASKANASKNEGEKPVPSQLCPDSHLACVNVSENIATKIVGEIIGCSDIDERTLTIWRYIVIAKMRLDVGDYQSVEFILSALSGCPVTRLKATWEGLPSEVLNLQKLMSGLSLKPDTHIMRYRTQPVIPSLPRIKKLMTYAEDKQVSNSKRNGIKAMFEIIREEINRQEEMEGHLNFFDLQAVTHTPWISLDTFYNVQYNISVAEIEKRGESIPSSDLFTGKTPFLPEMDFEINIDDKINTFLAMYSLRDEIQQCFKPIKNLIDDINDYQAIPGLKNAEDLLQETGLRKLDRLIGRLQDGVGKGESDDAYNAKIAELLQRLIKLRNDKSAYYKLEKKYKELEKKYREDTIASKDFTTRKNSLTTPKLDMPIYQPLGSSIKDTEKGKEKEKAEKRTEDGLSSSDYSDMDTLIIDLDNSQESPAEKSSDDSEHVVGSSRSNIETTASTSNIIAYLEAANVLAEEVVGLPEEQAIVEANEAKPVESGPDVIAAAELAIERPSTISEKLLSRFNFFEKSLSNLHALERIKEVKVEIEASEMQGVDIDSKIKLFDTHPVPTTMEDNAKNKLEEETVLRSVVS